MHLDPDAKDLHSSATTLRAALDDAIKSLHVVQTRALVRSAAHLYMRSRSGAISDPIKQLLSALKATRSHLSFPLPYSDTARSLSSIQQHLHSFRHHRLYPILLALAAPRRFSSKLERSLAALAEILPLPLGSIGSNSALPQIDPQLLNIDSERWKELDPLKDHGPDSTLIVIPVYGGRARTLACLHSVLVSQNDETRSRLLVIDDCSPETQLTSDLQRLATRNNFQFVHHAENRGFVSTANEGILASRDDVVVLNADTLVSDRWLDHLRADAEMRPDLGSLSPLTNNGTILSYPYTNTANSLPLDCSLEKLCAFLETRPHEDTLIEIPTPVGFCMYMRRRVIEEVGLFDEALFRLGYGEECDWAMRAREKGYRHYATTRTFVFHFGGTSFGDRAGQRQREAAEILRRRHPNYWPLVAEHIALDPLSKARRFLDCQRLVAASEQAPVVLHVLHSLGGGTEQYVWHLARLLKDQGVFSIFAQPDRVGRIRLSSNFLRDIPNTIFDGLRDDRELSELLKLIQIRCVHLHSVLGYSQESVNFLSQLDLPLIVTIHDYANLCPQIYLLNQFDLFCGVATVTICNQCIAAKRPHVSVTNVNDWRERMYQLLTKANRVIAPSRTAAELYNRAWPGLSISVIPNPEAATYPLPALKPRSDVRVVAIVGRILAHKGSAIVEDCVRDAEERELPLKFVVVGEIETQLKSPYLDVTGGFHPEELPSILSKLGAIIGFLPSVWPETYSYVLSEYYRFGLHPVVFDIGAQSERVKAAQYGTVLPLYSSAAAINDVLVTVKSELGPRRPPTGLPDEAYLNACYQDVLQAKFPNKRL